MLRRFLPVFALLLAPACAGSAKVEPIDNFGLFTSALWVHATYDGYETDSIMISNNLGLCQKLQTYAEVTKDAFDELEDIDFDDYCEDAKDPLMELADASTALYYDGAHYIEVVIEADEDLDEDSYDVGIGEDNMGYVVAYTEDLDQDWDEWDEDEDFEDDPYCGMDEPDDDGGADFWVFDEGGEMDVKSLVDEASASGSIEGDLLDDDGDDDGEMQATFSGAHYCELDYD